MRWYGLKTCKLGEEVSNGCTPPIAQCHLDHLNLNGNRPESVGTIPDSLHSNRYYSFSANYREKCHVSRCLAMCWSVWEHVIMFARKLRRHHPGSITSHFPPYPVLFLLYFDMVLYIKKVIHIPLNMITTVSRFLISRCVLISHHRSSCEMTQKPTKKCFLFLD